MFLFSAKALKSSEDEISASVSGGKGTLFHPFRDVQEVDNFTNVLIFPENWMTKRRLKDINVILLQVQMNR